MPSETAGQLKQSAHKLELYDALVEHVRDFAIVMLDPAGTVVSWNRGAQRILGYEEEAIVGRHFSLFFTPEDVANGRPEFELKEARDRGSIEDDNWLMRKDGSRFFGSGITSRLPGEPLRGYSKIFRDLTDRRRLEEEAHKRVEELAAADRYKDEFLAMLAHELRGPLAPIANALEILRLESSHSTTARQARAILERQVAHMTRLIEDLLDVARISKGKIALRKERTDLNDILERAVEASRPFIEARQHTLVVNRPDRPIWLTADAARLEQALNNLLTNSAKYTLPGGRIWLTAQRSGNRANVSVRDNGIGIAPGLLANVFELFVQGERTPDRAQGGLGIGLTLVKSIVEMHGGGVRALSAGVGHGAEFVLELPILDEEAPSAPEPDDSDSAVTRILVVDDSVDAADSLAMLLALDGYDVRTANDGIAAIAAAQDFRPDVMLMDIGLPGADGYTVAERIKRDPALGHVLLIAMTGYGQAEDRERSRAAGFRDHLVKPIDPHALHAILPASGAPGDAAMAKAAQSSAGGSAG
jgi:PAS domain S-box-containing protein